MLRVVRLEQEDARRPGDLHRRLARRRARVVALPDRPCRRGDRRQGLLPLPRGPLAARELRDQSGDRPRRQGGHREEHDDPTEVLRAERRDGIDGVQAHRRRRLENERDDDLDAPLVQRHPHDGQEKDDQRPGVRPTDGLDRQREHGEGGRHGRPPEPARHLAHLDHDDRREHEHRQPDPDRERAGVDDPVPDQTAQWHHGRREGERHELPHHGRHDEPTPRGPPGLPPRAAEGGLPSTDARRGAGRLAHGHVAHRARARSGVAARMPSVASTAPNASPGATWTIVTSARTGTRRPS